MVRSSVQEFGQPVLGPEHQRNDKQSMRVGILGKAVHRRRVANCSILNDVLRQRQHYDKGACCSGLQLRIITTQQLSTDGTASRMIKD